MRRLASTLICGVALAFAPTVAGAQAAPPIPVVQTGGGNAQTLPGLDSSRQWVIEKLGEHHWKLTGDVEIERDETKIFADEIEVHTDTHMLTARGNVVMTTPDHRVAANHAEFNTETKLGTFYDASGSATLPDKPQPSALGSQDSDVYFYGKTLEKIGEKKYRITDGGFTTCVQPRPRWELTSGSVVLNLDHYARLTNSFMKVKGIPVLYLPIIYYPINKEGRNTGFLMPVYGTSSLRGQTLSNAFFWAINRSQDATLTYDWFSKTGHAYGGEYRYVANRSSQGSTSVYLLRERPTTTTYDDGTVSETDGRKSFRLRSDVSQALPFRLRGRARVDYFSEISVQQAYYQNIYDASQRERSYSGSVSGNWGAYAASMLLDRSEVFYGTTTSTTRGNLPRLTFSRAERALGRTSLYTSLNGEFVAITRETDYNDTITKLSTQRFDLTPSLRLPFRRWAFLTANTSLSWRFTRWDKSLDDTTGEMVERSVDRQYIDLQTRIVGPVFNRIWNPGNRFADKVKHTIEPNVTVQRVSSFDTYDRIIKLDGTDSVVGGTTRVIYGLNNRLFVKRNDGDRQGTSKEIFNLSLRQTYYTNKQASTVDSSYSSSYTNASATRFSAVSLQATAVPSNTSSLALRVEYDPNIDRMKSLSLQSSYAVSSWLNLTSMWSKQRYFSNNADPRAITLQNQYATAQVSTRLFEGKVGGDLSLHYDFTKSLMLQERFVGFYQAQCCGFAVEYQVYDLTSLGLAKDKRFNLSITFGGIGTFSNFLGAFGVNSGSR